MKTRLFYLILVTILFNFNSCKKDENKSNNSIQLNDEYNENDYYKVQGIVIKETRSFNYVDKFKRDIQYVYRLDLDNPLIGTEKNFELMIHPEEPVAIMVNKKDSTISFIGHRGIIDDDLLVEYLTNHSSEYEKLINGGQTSN